ncbi:putative collagen alpha, partial [Sesbania bispinosa]
MVPIHPNPYFSNRRRAKSQGGEKLHIKRRLLSDRESRTKNQDCCSSIFTP